MSFKSKTNLVVVLIFPAVVFGLYIVSAFPKKPEAQAEYCAEELTQRVLNSQGKFEVKTHCVRREPYVLPEGH